jgi:hypothetical protein
MPSEYTQDTDDPARVYLFARCDVCDGVALLGYLEVLHPSAENPGIVRSAICRKCFDEQYEAGREVARRRPELRVVPTPGGGS